MWPPKEARNELRYSHLDCGVSLPSGRQEMVLSLKSLRLLRGGIVRVYVPERPYSVPPCSHLAGPELSGYGLLAFRAAPWLRPRG